MSAPVATSSTCCVCSAVALAPPMRHKRTGAETTIALCKRCRADVVAAHAMRDSGTVWAARTCRTCRRRLDDNAIYCSGYCRGVARQKEQRHVRLLEIAATIGL